MKLPRLTRSLIIPPRVLALPGLPLTARLVLAEAYDLLRLVGDASAPNAYYAQRLRCAERTIAQAVAQLVAAGYLARHYDAAPSRGRHLTPTTPRPTA